MFELVYNSIASTTLTEDDLLAIQKVSGNANSKIDITGCLFYLANEFVGILEGSEESVKKLFPKIQRDHNHSDISILAKGPIEERQFDQWNMISVTGTGPKNAIVDADNRLLVQNVLSLAQLTEKRTYGSRVFWYTVKKLLRETALQRANENDEGNL